MMGWGYGMGFGGWAVLCGLWVLLLVAAVLAVMWIFPRKSRRPSGAAGGTPLVSLDERLARGEIDVEQYRTLKAELTAGAGTRL